MASIACALSEISLRAAGRPACTWVMVVCWGWASRLPTPRQFTCNHYALLLTPLQVCATPAGHRSC